MASVCPAESAHQRPAASAQRSSTTVDHGVQIRFIDDLRDAGGGLPATAAATPSSSSSSSATKKTRTTKAQAARYGVAIRVQGIHGQPYVVLKDGGVNGDSYGVQLRTDYSPAYGSLPGRGRGRGAEPGGGGQPRPAGEGEGLRRAHSHGSLLDTETGDVQGGPGSGEEEGEGPTTQQPLTGSHGNQDRVGVAQSRSRWDDETSYRNHINSSLGPSQRGPPGCHQSLHDLPPAPTHPCPVPAHTNRWDRGAVPGHPEDIGDASPVLTPNPYSSPPSSTHSSLGRGSQGSVPSSTHSSLGRGGIQGHAVPSPSANKAAPPGRYVAVEKTPSSANQTGRYVAVETPSTNQTETWVTPDLLLDQGQSSELSIEEGEVMNTIYGLVRGGTNEGEDVVKRKVQIIFQRIQRLMGCSGQSQSEVSLKAQLDSSVDENLQLLERLDHSRAELHRAHEELSQLRMERENAESTVRQMEDRLSELQEDARRDGDNKTELASCQAELSTCGQRGRRAEEALRQRERELTALKGALKDEVESHDKEMEALREQYSTDMERLRGSMEALSQAGIEAERQRVNTSVRSLHQQLDDCRDESSHWMEQFHTARDQQRSTKQELLQACQKKEEFEEELKELQEKLNTVQQHTPDPTHTDGLNKEVERCRAELQGSKAELEKLKAETDRKVLELKTETDRKVLELIHAKKARQEQEAELKYEIDRLINQLQRAKEEVAKAQDKNKKLLEPAVMSELEAKLAESRGELGLLRDKLSSAEAELDTSRLLCSSAHTEGAEARDMQREQEKSNARLRDKISSLETQLQASATENSEAELSLHTELRALRAELDDTKRRASRLDQEHYETGLRREEAEKERDALRQAAAQLEESRRQHDRALEKLRNEYGSLSVSSGEEAQALRAQLEEQRERARKETQETQRHGAEMQTSLERNTHGLRRLEEEVSRQKKELSLACEERDNHQLDKELLTNRLRHLESELENSRSGLGDRSREVRSLEDKLKRVEAELEEERSSVEMLTDRVNRSRDQMDSLRSELMTERSSKQDLELDKNAMERHLKELRVRLADMEGQSRPSVGVTQLESKVQELLERLTTEEREKNSVLASQRRLERKLKDVNMALDEERHQDSEQRDQLSLRVKALKRQVDEGESELERMDGLRRKSQREAEEQAEQKEALQTRVTALENELKRKVQTMRRSALDSSALSSEDEDDDLYDTSTITSILTESNLQTSSC